MQEQRTTRAGEGCEPEIQVATHPQQALAHVEMADGRSGCLELATLPLQQRSFSGYEPETQVVEPLLTPPDNFLDARKRSVLGQFSQPLPAHEELVAHGPRQAA